MVKKFMLATIMTAGTMLGTVAVAAAYTCPQGSTACTIQYFDADGHLLRTVQSCCVDG